MENGELWVGELTFCPVDCHEERNVTILIDRDGYVGRQTKTSRTLWIFRELRGCLCCGIEAVWRFGSYDECCNR